MIEKTGREFPLYISEYHSSYEDVVDEYISVEKIIKEVNATFEQAFTTIEEVDKYIEENASDSDGDIVYFYTKINSQEEYDRYYKYEW